MQVVFSEATGRERERGERERERQVHLRTGV